MKKSVFLLSVFLGFCLCLFSACQQEPEYTPIPEETLTVQQQELISVAKRMDIALLQIDEKPTEQQKFAFLHWYLSEEDYAQQLEQWLAQDDQYHIPQEEVERILFTFLNTDSVDFTDEVWHFFDVQTREYIVEWVGGYGGAHFRETIRYDIDGDRHHITLGTFDPENETELLGHYDVIFEVSETGEYCVLSAKDTVTAKDKEKKSAYLN